MKSFSQKKHQIFTITVQGSNVVPLTVESASGTMPTYLGQDTADVQSSQVLHCYNYVFPIV